MKVDSVIKNICTNLNLNLIDIKKEKGGSNNKVYSVFTKELELIFKFPRQRIVEGEIIGENEDKMFGGKLSLERETFILDLMRSFNVPVPKYYGIFETELGRCIVVEKIKGTNMAAYLKNKDYKLDEFLSIVKSLGENIKKLHAARFESFGNIMDNNIIEPSNIYNFIDRYKSVNDMVLTICKNKKCFNEQEFKTVEQFIEKKFDFYYDELNIQKRPATFAITDLHEGNFHVENSVVSGFFDVESSQAAPKEFELYCLRFFIFNFFGRTEYDIAEKIFWKSYYNNEKDFPDDLSSKIIDFFSFLRLV
ncbi:MAG: hypothetical protein GYA87_02905, partial [Christensenellaceae bacterium]|nr:hypothetical protein [Christensenellaceae bacterium]